MLIKIGLRTQFRCFRPIWNCSEQKHIFNLFQHWLSFDCEGKGFRLAFIASSTANISLIRSVGCRQWRLDHKSVTNESAKQKKIWGRRRFFPKIFRRFFHHFFHRFFARKKWRKKKATFVEISSVPTYVRYVSWQSRVKTVDDKLFHQYFIKLFAVPTYLHL
jgi:hypothetical protein